MPQVLVRDLDLVVIDRFHRRAQQSGRSLEAELRLILERAANEQPSGPSPEVERVRKMFAGRTFGDSADLIREDRER